MPAPGVCKDIVEARHKQDGYGSATNPEKFNNQDYHQLKKDCLIQGVRYVDKTFPPNMNSIGDRVLTADELAHVQWLRPAKLARNPTFILDGVSRFDFGQGKIGNCWFLSSIGALTFQDKVLKQVVPFEQAFDENYCGLFHFRFWRFGRWVDVVIDDKLPTINGRLIFVHSKDQNEFWPALMEKAYAKVCGSYTDMTSGTPADAMMDFTGGIHIRIQLSEPPSDLWHLMCRAGQFNSLMCCGTRRGKTAANTELPNGLVLGHAYTVTGVKQLMSQGKQVHLVRLWNPWGKGEWNGHWSDESSLWNTVSPQDRKMCVSVADDGEFWMSLGDLCKFYTDLDICCLTPDFLDGSSCKWKTSTYEGRWVAGTTAGGCTNHRDSFWTNPQYRVKTVGEHSGIDGEKNMLVSLMQKHDKKNRRLVENFFIGVTIYEVPEKYKDHKGKFPASFFNTHRPVALTKTFLNAREVMEFVLLKPGEYVIVPSTLDPNQQGSFLLTILSKTEAHAYENSSDHQDVPVKKIKSVTTAQEVENRKNVFQQYSDEYGEVGAEQLQQILNDRVLKGDLKKGGFSIDACRSMVSLMDSSVTGKLNGDEFVRLWKKVVMYKDIFFSTDVDRTGTLSLGELRNAFAVSGMRVSDEILNLMALRYSDSTGHMTLESFITLILRFDCMHKIFKQLSDGKSMSLRESEWIRISMYT